MNWLWPRHIPPELGLSREQRKTVRRAAWKLWARERRNLLLYLALPVTYLVAVRFMADVGGVAARLAGAPRWLHAATRAAAPVVWFVVCFVVGGAVLQRYRFAPCVYRALRQHGYDVCTKCGYWLKGLGANSDTCPECGAIRPEPPQDAVPGSARGDGGQH